jgi:cyclophilin family peptidyl-prolyl cis-trans isomerase
MDHDTKTTYLVIIALIVLLGGLAFFLRGTGLISNDSSEAAEAYSTTTPSVSTTNKPITGSSTPMSTSTPSVPNKVSTAIITTNMGVVEITFATNTPNTVANFAKLAASGFYNGTRFHRVIKDFMIQGGDPLSKDVANKARWGTGGPGYTFADETSPNDVLSQGTLAMANAGANTNGSQFFIVTAAAGTPWLSGKHTVFGHVTKGMDTVLKIEGVKTDAGDKPLQDVIVEKVEVR